LNAILPPRVADSTIGGRNTLRSMIEDVQHGYFCKSSSISMYDGY
jgi:hypothetical protein